MSFVAVENDADYATLLGEIDRLIDADCDESELVQAFSSLVEAYDAHRFPKEPAGLLSNCPWHRKAA